ncbi:unnamed protein product, partial [Allacma fusca]
RGNGASKWGQKRKTKNREVFSENIENAQAFRSSFSDSAVILNSDSPGDSVALTRIAHFPDITRRRKILGLESTPDDDPVVVKDESCSASPIWEGQTHRVPDLQVVTRAEGQTRPLPPHCPDLVHCVPNWDTDTYPYVWPSAGVHGDRPSSLTGVPTANTFTPSASAEGMRAKGSSAP